VGARRYGPNTGPFHGDLVRAGFARLAQSSDGVAVAAREQVNIDALSCPGTYYLSWTLYNSAGGAVGSGSCSNGRIQSLPPGPTGWW
jgi:hypothetical protein